MTRNMNLDHSKASHVVRFWKPKWRDNPFKEEYDADRHNNNALTYTYRFPGEGYLIQVSFSEMPSHPDLMMVRSTNWRAEHEPSGIFMKDECRNFARSLLAAGFVRLVDEN